MRDEANRITADATERESPAAAKPVMGATGLSESILIPPYGGRLVRLLASENEREALAARAKNLASVQISSRSVCDLELLAVGAFSPLDRFMGSADYRCVLAEMRLANGMVFPLPITLPVKSVDGLKTGQDIALRSPTNAMLAIMRIDEIYEWDLEREARSVLHVADSRHPLVSEMKTWGRFNLSGPLTVLSLPAHDDYPLFRKTPEQVRNILAAMGRRNVVAYQPRRPMYRPHEALTKAAMAEVDGSLLIHPVVGATRYGDIDHYTRVRCLKTLIEGYYDPARTLLNLLPLAARMAGPRAGLWHGIINRNYGANHVILGRDPDGPSNNPREKEFYDTREVQALFSRHSDEIGVTMIPHREMVFLPAARRFESYDSALTRGEPYVRVSAERSIDECLQAGREVPSWLMAPEVARVLRRVYVPRSRRGFCIWLTGLPGSGKSTITNALTPLLLDLGRKVTLLDGDVVRTQLTKGLGFSREDRDTNVLRVGFVAAEVVRHDGVAICALVSPFCSVRDQVRALVGSDRFIEVFVDTPVSVCEKRDVKGMYRMAKRGEIKGFTGVDDPYEPPSSPEIRICTGETSPEEAARTIVAYLRDAEFLETESQPRFPRDEALGLEMCPLSGN